MCCWPAVQAQAVSQAYHSLFCHWQVTWPKFDHGTCEDQVALDVLMDTASKCLCINACDRMTASTAQGVLHIAMADNMWTSDLAHH